MKYFLDRELTQEAKVIKFGIVPAGESKRITVYVQNDDNAYLRQIAFKPAHREVIVVSAPHALDPGEVGELVLEWRPSVTLKEGLDTQIFVEAVRLYGRL